MRAGELIALRHTHVDRLRRTITVTEQVQYTDGRYVASPPKSAAGRRSVALPRMVADELELHLRAEADADALVFPAPHGCYLHLENFRKRVWLPAVRPAGLETLRIHALRHTVPPRDIAADTDIKALDRNRAAT